MAAQWSSSGGKRTAPISARVRSAAANSRTASWLAPTPAATSPSASRHAGTKVAWPPSAQASGWASACCCATGQSPPGRPGVRGQAGERGHETIAEPLSELLRLRRGGLGGAVGQQPARLGEQAERPRGDEALASLDQRKQALRAGREPPTDRGEVGKGEVE
jgi:hypothetical protein